MMWTVEVFAIWTFLFSVSSSRAYCPYQYRCAPGLRDHVKPACSYRCCLNNGWVRGQFPDETPCWLKRRTRTIGACMRGNCISWSAFPGSSIPGRPARPIPTPPEPLPSCNEIVTAAGYAKGCSYKCLASINHIQMKPYPEGTPCLEIDQARNKPASTAGLCLEGKCVSHYDIKGDYPTVMAKVYPANLLRCPEKVHLGRNAVFNCRYHCMLGDTWFFGTYMANTTCQTDDPALLGWCCKDKCYPEMWCGGNENSVDYRLK